MRRSPAAVSYHVILPLQYRVARDSTLLLISIKRRDARVEARALHRPERLLDHVVLRRRLEMRHGAKGEGIDAAEPFREQRRRLCRRAAAERRDEQTGGRGGADGRRLGAPVAEDGGPERLHGSD